MKLHKKYQAAKLVLPIAGSVLVSGAVSQLPPRPIEDGLRLLAGTASLLATGKAWCDATELEGMEAQNAADDAVRAAAIEADARCNASYYRRHPNHFRANKPVPEEWRQAWAASGGNPALMMQAPQLQRALQASQLTQPIAQQPQTQPIQQPGQVRGGSFDRAAVPESPGTGWGDYEPRPIPPIAQPQVPTFTAPIAATSPKPYTPALFDWQLFRHDPDRYAHAVVLGSTGDGKTSLQEWLARLIGGGNELIILTTKKRGLQWHGLNVTGLGRDFQPISDQWRSVESGLNTRCADLDLAQSQPQIICAIDELNDVVANSDVDLANVARAGREARVRIIVNSHSEGVDGLGLKGKNDIKHCFSWVRLGQFAINHGRSLANKNLLSQADLTWLESQQRPCMVGDMVAQIPSLPEGWQSRLGGSQHQPSTPPTQTPEAQSTTSFEPSPPPMLHASESPASRSEAPRIAPSPQPEASSDREAELLAQFSEMKSMGMNKKQICFALWGAKMGGTDRYRMASDFYDRLNSKYSQNTGDSAA